MAIELSEVLQIEAPVEAQAGSTVTIGVIVRCLHSTHSIISTFAMVNGNIPVTFEVSSLIATYHFTYIFYGTFTMPNANAVIRADVLYLETSGEVHYWVSVDYMIKTVMLAGGVPPNGDPTISGMIAQKILKYDSTEGAIPVGTIPPVEASLSTGGQIHLYCSYAASGAKQMEITWQVSDPDGIVADSYHDFDTWPYTPPGSLHHFIGSRFNLLKPGVYTLQAYLQIDGVMLASYSGVLCTVVGVITKTLEVDITPVGSGHVETNPASTTGKTVWHNNEVSTFPYGTSIEVTAVPAEGYVFDHWSDKIVGGVSYQNPAMVQDLFGNYAVKAHFSTVGTISGSIQSKQVIHGSMDPFDITGTEVDIPAANILVGQWFKLKVVGLNTSFISAKLGLKYVVTKPDGTHFTDTVYEAFSTQPDDLHTFIEPTVSTFDVDQEGTWSVAIDLLDEAGNSLDSYTGTLFTTIGVPPNGGETGLITSVLIIHGTYGLFQLVGEEKEPPVQGAVSNEWFKIKVVGLNPSTEAMQMGLRHTITKPDGTTILGLEEEDWPHTGGGESHTFIEPTIKEIAIDQAGNWSLSLELLGDGVTIDTWEGLIFGDVTEAPAGMLDIMSMIPLLIMVMMMSMVMGMMEEPGGFMAAAGRKIERGKEIAAPIVQIFTGKPKAGKE